MKRNKIGLIVKSILSLILLSSCGNSSSPSLSYPGWKPGDETYTVSFVSEGEVVKTYENVKYGDYVDIPTLTHSNTRYAIDGWDGMDDTTFKSGKVMVYENNATYTARWDERFGSEETFTATRRNVNTDITIDGQKDIAYNDTMAIDINTVTKSSTTTNAKVYVMWDEIYLYVLIEVNDSTYNAYSSGNINDFDSVNMCLDILHDDSLVLNHTTGWGGVYRGEPGPMCEGWFKIGAGVSYPNSEGDRYGNGSEFMFDGWLSNAAKESGTTVGTTLKTNTGYNVEYKIDCTNVNVPANLRLHDNQEIGLGLNIFDKTSSDVAVISLEDFNYDMYESPKKLSNFKLIKNPNQNKNIITATHVRDSYKVNNKDKYDNLFNDTIKSNLSNNATVQTLWDADGLYMYFDMGDADQITLTSELFSGEKVVNNNTKLIIDAELIKENTPSIEFNVDGEEIECVYALMDNNNNVSPTRKLMEADYLEATEEIVIDGVKDDAYNNNTEIDVSTKSLIENNSLNISAKAYMKWDNDYLYIFVDVTDANVDQTTYNQNSPEKNDSVEIWMSTCQTIPTLQTKWGWPNGGVNSMRPYELYCGEGKIARRAGEPEGHTVGTHWMWDNSSVTKETASVVTSYGYTTEFKIGWGTFKDDVLDKNNEIINLSININDGENNNRKGIVSTNENCHEIYFAPGYLDNVILVNK